MRNKLVEVFMFPVLFVLLLVDGQLSTLVTNWSVDLFSVSSHLVFMLAIFYANYVSVRFSLLVFTLLGLIYDISYLGLIGIAITTFPLVGYCIYFFFQGFDRKRGLNALILLVVVFQFEFISYLFARIFHMTNLSVFIFVFNKLLPSLVFNLLLFLVLQPLLERLFGITNKT
ncbi:rod shape-determining protein MreD [Streptococcus ruminantium]|uniref:Rod shape-determining protein MreD n=1 Tax=Streptococcus ruminantium TaxID=1917441 RepID=A0ABU1B2W3_9STRE|nr:rod shape-determining protein MreD [Streptococcus ruminantium]MDQ8759546.1 rod shape-determining protein MreD [Streptococcus ruminantium]MDQ8764489.1 rod shape-determining protein MreD [Streptococcus ruminantium]MDQ8766365.1 rod shape-determining protein MreD [Streptococcus ruminantium]MDQ8768573.1 rod shape-determining protein MreD [Streptococcus ruminantium]MDQ8775659.1 rod shape-determining protein MreD [Streptococcus ruminantium]